MDDRTPVDVSQDEFRRLLTELFGVIRTAIESDPTFKLPAAQTPVTGRRWERHQRLYPRKGGHPAN